VESGHAAAQASRPEDRRACQQREADEFFSRSAARGAKKSAALTLSVGRVSLPANPLLL